MTYAVNDLHLFNLWNALCPTDFAMLFFYGKSVVAGIREHESMVRSSLLQAHWTKKPRPDGR